MTTFYLDTSALLKRYVHELGSSWIRAITSPGSGHALLTASITTVEVYSALARRKREGTVPAADCLAAANAFSIHAASEYRFVEFTQTIILNARHLLDQYPLRAYDAVQLASANVSNQTLKQAGLPEIVFLTSDDRLIDVAKAEGLMTDNPCNHP
ncbi:MAG: type II toxin-antitoxin system VapC family toxin [Chloroflexi bacterium]|nr:type II toxin-antitoxin system VapC family toxin [Chloroflexota bacterium]